MAYKRFKRILAAVLGNGPKRLPNLALSRVRLNLRDKLLGYSLLSPLFSDERTLFEGLGVDPL